MFSVYRRGSPFARSIAVIAAISFAWSFILAAPAQAMAYGALHPRPVLGLRKLTEAEMKRIEGRVGGHATSATASSGSTFPWEATVSGTNTANGNKLSSIPIIGWTARGGLPVAFTLNHNSQSAHNSELGYKWTHSFDIYLISDLSGNLTVHWGDDLAYQFTLASSVYTAPVGIHETLVQNIDGTYTLTKPDQTTYHFKTNFYCDTISDENGNSISISYNAGNYVTSISDPTSRAISLSYDGSNRISTITDPLSRVWTCHYTSGDLTSVDLPTIAMTTYSWVVAYNAAHDITTLTTPGSRSQSFTYNSSDDSLATETDGCGNTSTWTQTATTTTIADANSHSVAYTYSGGHVVSLTDAASQTEYYTWDAYNNKTQVTDKRGYSWNFTFDSAGNCLTDEDPYSKTTTRTFNGHNRLLTSTDPLSHVTETIVYDANDNPTSVTDALSHAVSTSWTTHGLPDTITDSLSHSVGMTYDTDGNCTLITDANSNDVGATFDGLGHKLSTTDELSHTVSYTLDAWSRVTEVTTPAGSTTIALDPDGLTTSVTDSNSHTTSQTFDADGRPLVTTKANGDTFTNSWDASGKKGLLSSTTDGNSHTTSYSYTARDQKSGASYPDSTTEGWTYDANGAMASHTDGRGYASSYTLDHAGRLTGISFPHDTGVSFVYDDASRKVSMTDVTGTTGWTYDNANRCTQIAQPNGTVSYTFDNANRRTAMTISGTGSWGYSFDAANRLTSTTNPNSETTSFTLDAAGRTTRQDNANGTYVLNTFDTANRITEIKTKNSSATVLSDIQYSYDGVNETTRTDSDGTVTTFGFDNSNQLASEVRDNSHSTGYTIGYTYDHNQNRATKTLNSVTDSYSYDSHDKLTSTSSKSFSYDSAGNCTAVTVGGNTTSLTWDDSSRCVGITYPSAATNSFVYNGDDLRVSKTDSAGTSSPITDGTTPASAVLKDARAVYTPGISERTTSSPASKYYHTDALGSTRGITDASQTVTDAVLYDAFGMTVSRTGSTPTPFGFVGAGQYQTDADSGLQLLGHRMYLRHEVA